LKFEGLGTASLIKECLRNIYRMADCCQNARTTLILWCEKAEVSGIHCLNQMAKTIRKRIEGLLAFLKHHRLTNANQEGFNLNSAVGTQGHNIGQRTVASHWSSETCRNTASRHLASAFD
jgi:hypothetical protein